MEGENRNEVPVFTLEHSPAGCQIYPSKDDLPLRTSRSFKEKEYQIYDANHESICFALIFALLSARYYTFRIAVLDSMNSNTHFTVAAKPVS
jgi:hypothetical protein